MASRRTRTPPGFHVQVGGIGGSSERLDLDLDTDRQAIEVAFSAISTFGHTLGSGRRFLGHFAAGDARLERLSAHRALPQA